MFFWLFFQVLYGLFDFQSLGIRYSLGDLFGQFGLCGSSLFLGLSALNGVKFFDPGGPALQSSQIVELGAADVAIPGYFKRLDQGRI